MKSYWISLYLKVENQDNLKKYAEVVTPIIKASGECHLLEVENIKHLMEMILKEQLYGNFQVMKKL